MVEYRIARGINANNLEWQVKENIKDGWLPLGEMKILKIRERKPGFWQWLTGKDLKSQEEDFVYLQNLVRMNEPDYYDRVFKT